MRRRVFAQVDMVTPLCFWPGLLVQGLQALPYRRQGGSSKPTKELGPSHIENPDVIEAAGNQGALDVCLLFIDKGAELLPERIALVVEQKRKGAGFRVVALPQLLRIIL